MMFFIQVFIWFCKYNRYYISILIFSSRFFGFCLFCFSYFFGFSCILMHFLHILDIIPYYSIKFFKFLKEVVALLSEEKIPEAGHNCTHCKYVDDSKFFSPTKSKSVKNNEIILQ